MKLEQHEIDGIEKVIGKALIANSTLEKNRDMSPQRLRVALASAIYTGLVVESQDGDLNRAMQVSMDAAQQMVDRLSGEGWLNVT